MIEPPVCVPNATGTMKSATAAADPLDEPPGVCAGLCGFVVSPGDMPANSAVTVLPRITAPAAHTNATQPASENGRLPLYIAEPISVGRSAVSIMSLTPIGTPC